MFILLLFFFYFFFFNDTATTEIYTLSLHDALRSRARTSLWRAADLPCRGMSHPARTAARARGPTPDSGGSRPRAASRPPWGGRPLDRSARRRPRDRPADPARRAGAHAPFRRTGTSETSSGSPRALAARPRPPTDPFRTRAAESTRLPACP